MSTVSPPAQEQQGKMAYKWIVAIVVVFGTFMSILDQTVVNNALPTLQRAFATDLSSIQWIITAYTLTQGVVTPITAFFADRLGSKRFYIIALAFFTAGSALCGLAWNLPSMIVFRIIQGIGGAVLFPLSIALLFREFPPQQRGTASAIISFSAMIAPAAGPTLGGYFVTFASWPLIFLINIPLGLIGIVMAIFLLREVRTTERRSFDTIGFVLVASGLVLILYALSEVSTSGWGSTAILTYLACGLLLLILFLIHEFRVIARSGQPLLELRLFAKRNFWLSNGANALIGFAFFGSLILTPIYLQDLRGLNAFESGLFILPMSAASLVTTILGGRLIDRFGPRLVLLPGVILMLVTTWWLAQATLDMSYEWLVVIMLVRGLGMGFLFQPLTVASMADLPPQQFTHASSLTTVFRFVFTALGIAVLATVVQTRAAFHVEGQLNTAVPLELARREGLNLAVQDAFWLTLIVFALVLVMGACIHVRKAEVTTTSEKAGTSVIAGE